MSPVTIQSINHRAASLLDALPRSHPLPATSCQAKTRRLQLVILRLSRIVNSGLHVDRQVGEAHSLLSKAQQALSNH